MLQNSKKTKKKYTYKRIYKINRNFIYKSGSKYKSKYKKQKKFQFLKKIYFLFLLLFIFFSLNKERKISKIINNKNNILLSNTKICICTLAKQENLYIREYLDHYKNYGVN